MRMLSGMGELHLDVIMERMGREYGISPRKGQPQVVMRETILRRVMPMSSLTANSARNAIRARSPSMFHASAARAM